MGMLSADAEAEVVALLEPFRTMEGGLIPALQKIQEKYGYLSEEHLKLVARELNVPLADVYGVATFYALFKLKQKGLYTIFVCRGTACHIKGGDDILREFERILGIHPDQTTPDGKFTLQVVNCLGSCSLAPVVKINDEIYGNVSVKDVAMIIDKHRREGKA